MATTVQPQVPAVVQDGHTELRRLKPAADAVARAGQLGEQAVQQVLTRAPPSLKPSLEAAVERASPLVAKAADSGATLLKAADERVDAALDAATNAYAKNSAYLQEQLARQKEFHAQNLESYKQAREAYLQKVERAVEYMKEKGLVGAARDAADEVLARVGEAKAAVMAAPAALVHKVQAAVDRLLAFGPVSSAVEAAKPHLATAKAQYLTVHDRVLATPQYRQAFDLANQLAARLEQTWLYSTARARLPASAVETATPYLNSVVQHLKPIAA